jgi:hypothetical protein
MSGIPNEEEMIVARAIRQAFETEANPGNMVSGPIPHMLQGHGTFNLIRAAGIVLQALGAHRAVKAAQAAKQAEQAAASKAAEQAPLKVNVTFVEKSATPSDGDLA